MERNNKKRKKVLSVLVLLLLVLGITIGYSVLSQTLNIQGTSSVGGSTWNVHFENVQVDPDSVSGTNVTTAPVASGTNTISLSYNVTLNQPGDFYEFTVDVKNGGSIDAKLNEIPTITGPTPAQDVYTNAIFVNSDDTPVVAGQTLAAGAKRTYKVRVEFDSNVNASQLPTVAQTVPFNVSMEWVQA
ncbi:MAG: hypothetical protein IJI58_03300 [Bacilli bacterium]|nr:hypothetical protein [Bacilli bacterium]